MRLPTLTHSSSVLSLSSTSASWSPWSSSRTPWTWPPAWQPSTRRESSRQPPAPAYSRGELVKALQADVEIVATDLNQPMLDQAGRDGAQLAR